MAGTRDAEGAPRPGGERDRVAVLVVDDIEENLIAMQALLTSDETEVVVARSGPEALELLLVCEVALAIVDVQMPGMDGFELASLMRGSARTRQIPIIFVTAAALGSDTLFSGYEAGAVDFLVKPLRAHVLRSKVAVFLELTRQRRALESQLRTNEMIMAAVGHDLRNPLNAITIAVQLLGERAADGDRKVLERMTSSCRRMARLIDDLYDVSRSRLGSGIQLERTSGVDLEPILRAVIAEMKAQSDSGRVWELHAEACRGHWDGARLARVFSNLLANAVRHGVAGKPIVARVVADEGAVRVRISNAGRIAPEVLPHIWDPFRGSSSSPVDADGTPARGAGLGLGLYIVRAIVEAHGGRVSATSADGVVTFEVALPRGEPARAERPRRAESQPIA